MTNEIKCIPSEVIILMLDSLSSLYTFDLNTQKLLKRYDLSGEHFMKDMVVDTNENKYLTESKDQSVFLFKTDADGSGIFHGINGLEFYKNHWYAIQKGVQANGFNFPKLILNEAQDKTVDTEIIESDNTDLYVPLTPCFAENKSDVIGNSNLGHWNQETMQFAKSDTILKTKLLVYTIE